MVKSDNLGSSSLILRQVLRRSDNKPKLNVYKLAQTMRLSGSISLFKGNVIMSQKNRSYLSGRWHMPV